MNHANFDIRRPHETLAELLKGASISRFGDGECKIMQGKKRGADFQRFDQALAAELRSIIGTRDTAALVGVFHFDGPLTHPAHYESMTVWADHIMEFAGPGKTYYSTLISRPDVLPTLLGIPEWFDRLAQLWKGKRVTLIANGSRSLTAKMLIDEGADAVDFIKCDEREAYKQIDDLERRALGEANETIIMCAGMTATCLAERLARKGRQALDLGHCGIFWRRYEEIPRWYEFRKEATLDKHTGQLIGNPT